MEKGIDKKIFLFVILLLSIFSPLMVFGQYLPPRDVNGDIDTRTSEQRAEDSATLIKLSTANQNIEATEIIIAELEKQYNEAIANNQLETANELKQEINLAKRSLQAQREEVERLNNNLNVVAKPDKQVVPFICTIKEEGFNLNIDWNCMLAKGTYIGLYQPAAWFLSISGQAFNWTVENTILKMQSFYYGDEESAVTYIDDGWKIFRDAANIIFIFVLLYAAIQTIFQGTGSTGKMVATVIAVAVLINFSLLFSKIVIDISNNLAISLYNSFKNSSTVESGPESPEDTPAQADDQTSGIAEAFIAKTKIVTIMEGETILNDNTGNETKLIQIFYQSLFGAVILLVLGGVLILVAIMLVTRLLILMVVLMTSSLAFGSWVLPQFKKTIGDKWWNALIGQSFFAPIFFLFLYVSFIFVDAVSTTLNIQGDWSNILEVDPALVLLFFMTIGMIIMSLTMATTLAKQAGSSYTQINDFLKKPILGTANWAARKTGGAIKSGTKATVSGALSTAAWASRNTIGQGANFIDRRLDGSNLLSRATKSVAGKISKSSFDPRNTSAGKSLPGKARGKGGFQQEIKNSEKKTKERYEALGKATIQEEKAIAAWNKMRSENEEIGKLATMWEEAEKEKKKKESEIKKLEAAKSSTANPKEQKEIQAKIEEAIKALNFEKGAIAKIENDIKKLDDKAISTRTAATNAAKEKKNRQNKYLKEISTGWGRVLSLNVGPGTADYYRQQLGKNIRTESDHDQVLSALKDLKSSQKSNDDKS